MLYFVIYILLVHYVADFVCQTNWMALNKSKSNLALGAHVVTYTVVMLVGLYIALIFHTMPWLWLFCLINGVIHFAVDYTTSRISSRFWEKGQRAFFWWTIGFDQWIHQATLILLVALLLQ